MLCHIASVWQRVGSNPLLFNFFDSVEPNTVFPFFFFLLRSHGFQGFSWFFLILHQPSSPNLQLPTLNWKP